MGAPTSSGPSPEASPFASATARPRGIQSDLTSSASMASAGPHVSSGEKMPNIDACDYGPTLRFDTQAEEHIFSSREFFPNGVDSSVQLNLGTIVKGAAGRTAGVGRAQITLATGQKIEFAKAHLFEYGTSNVVATSLLPSHVTVLHIAP